MLADFFAGGGPLPTADPLQLSRQSEAGRFRNGSSPHHRECSSKPIRETSAPFDSTTHIARLPLTLRSSSKNPKSWSDFSCAACEDGPSHEGQEFLQGLRRKVLVQVTHFPALRVGNRAALPRASVCSPLVVVPFEPQGRRSKGQARAIHGSLSVPPYARETKAAEACANGLTVPRAVLGCAHGPVLFAVE